MQAPYTPHYNRIASVHGSKRHLLGNPAQQVPPAWRTNGQVPPGHAAHGSLAKGRPQEMGSKIFLSRLPADVGEKEVEELFRVTVGPLKDSFLVYNSQGRSKGMAVVTFQKPGDAVAARDKYDGKVVDGRRPIKIEVIVDGAPPTSTSSQSTHPPSLLDRLARTQRTQASQLSPDAAPSTLNPRQAPFHERVAKETTSSISAPTKSPTKRATAIPPRKVRQRKGPKRLKKLEARRAMTAADLDKEMEDYQAAKPLFPES